MQELWIDNVIDFTNPDPATNGIREYLARRDGAETLNLEAKSKTVGEGGMLAATFPTYGAATVLQEQPIADLSTSDLSLAIGLCAACGPKLDVWLAKQKKMKSYPNNESPWDVDNETGERPTMAAEAYRETACGLLEPAVEHWFTQAEEDAQLSHGLVRPDGIPDEQMEQLRALMLSQPAPKQPKLTLDQLRKLGFASDDESVLMAAHLETKGGLFAPDF